MSPVNSRVKILLAFCCARHPRQFDTCMPHDNVRKTFFFIPWAPQRPKVPPLGHDPGDGMRIQFDMYCIYYL